MEKESPILTSATFIGCVTRTQETQCKYGENYNPSTTSCAPPDQVDCGGRPTVATTSAWSTIPDGLLCVTANQVIPDPTDCKSFWQCDADLTPIRKHCDYDKYFDVSSGECAAESDVDCGSRSTIPSTTPYGVDCIVANQQIPDPTWCNAYWVCNSDLVPVRRECNQGTYYDPTSLTCMDAADEDCGSRSTLTTAMTTVASSEICVVSGQYIPDPTYCNLYWTCDANLTPTRQDCGTNYYFDATTNGCTYYVYATCSTGHTYTAELNVTPVLH